MRKLIITKDLHLSVNLVANTKIPTNMWGIYWLKTEQKQKHPKVKCSQESTTQRGVIKSAE